MTRAQIWLWNCIAFDLRYLAKQRKLEAMQRTTLQFVAKYGGAEAARRVREGKEPFP